MSHQELVGYWLRKTYGPQNVFEQVTVRPYTRSGRLGEAVRLDFVVKDPETGRLLMFDAKPQEGGIKLGQRLGFENIKAHGGQVRSSKFEGLPQGTDLPPGEVTPIRETNAEIRKLKDEFRGTLERQIDAPGTANRLGDQRIIGTGDARGVTTRGLAEPIGETASGGLERAGSEALASQVGSASDIIVKIGSTLLRRLTMLLVEVIELLNWADIALFVVDLVKALLEREFKEKRREAIEKAIRTDLPVKLAQFVRSRGSEIAEYYLRKWGKPEQLFLYSRPFMYVSSLPGTKEERYRFKIEFATKGTIAKYVSHKPRQPYFNEINPDWDNYLAELRWSLPSPLFTPFDAYRAYLDLIGAIFIARWQRTARRKKLSSGQKRQLSELAWHFATIAALLKKDYSAGFSGTEPFDDRQAVADRETIVLQIGDLVDKKIAALADGLRASGVLNPDSEIVVLGTGSSALNQRLDRLVPSGLSISQYLRRLSTDLAGIPKNYLGYRRGIKASMLSFWNVEAYRYQYYRDLVGPVWAYLPEDEKNNLLLQEGSPSPSGLIQVR